jgi:hypothetical protein
MTSDYPPWGRAQLELRVEADLGRRSGEMNSKYVASLLARVDKLEQIIRAEWHQLEPARRAELHAMVLGVRTKRTMRERWLELFDHFLMAWALTWNGSEVRRYIARSYGVADLIQEKVGQDIWAKALASPDIVAAAERGLADVLAGRTVELKKH